MAAQRPLPSPQKLRVEAAACLNGLGKAVGETAPLRRAPPEVATRPAAWVGAPPMKRVAGVRRDYLNGSFSTTFTPLIVPVTTPRTFVHGRRADLAGAPERAGGRCSGRLLGADAQLLRPGDRALHGAPGRLGDVPTDLGRRLHDCARARADRVGRADADLLGSADDAEDRALCRRAHVGRRSS